MKVFLVLISILVCFALSSDDGLRKQPLYRIAFHSSDDSADSQMLVQHLRNQITSSKRGHSILSAYTFPKDGLVFDEKGDADENTKLWLSGLGDADKFTWLQTSSAGVQIKFIDVLNAKVEYSNTLPESLTKTLLNDFYTYLDKRNVLLALSETKSSSTNPIKFSSLKNKYVAGESIRFELESLEDNYVYVVLVPEKKTEEPVLLFPNPNQTGNYLKKGQKVTIPEGAQALRAAPQGKDKIRAFTSKEEWVDLQLRGKKEDSFYKLLPPAMTGTKSLTFPSYDKLSKTIAETNVSEWEYEISQEEPQEPQPQTIPTTTQQ